MKRSQPRRLLLAEDGAPTDTAALTAIDADTGEPHWTHKTKGNIWGSTLVADGRVYVGSGRNYFSILKAGKELNELARIRMRDGVLSTPTAANGVLYLATNRHLYAIAADDQAAE